MNMSKSQKEERIERLNRMSLQWRTNQYGQKRLALSIIRERDNKMVVIRVWNTQEQADVAIDLLKVIVGDDLEWLPDYDCRVVQN